MNVTKRSFRFEFAFISATFEKEDGFVFVFMFKKAAPEGFFSNVVPPEGPKKSHRCWFPEGIHDHEYVKWELTAQIRERRPSFRGVFYRYHRPFWKKGCGTLRDTSGARISVVNPTLVN